MNKDLRFTPSEADTGKLCRCYYTRLESGFEYVVGYDNIVKIVSVESVSTQHPDYPYIKKVNMGGFQVGIPLDGQKPLYPVWIFEYVPDEPEPPKSTYLPLW